MSVHRVFLCVDFSDNVIKEVVRVQEILGNFKFTGKMTELENLHLTLKFLGEIDDKKLDEVIRRLSDVQFDKFLAKLDSVGIFNYHKNPKIIWIKIGGEGIFELQKKVDDVLKDLGFKEESRFMSHMTIARVKYVKDKIGFREYTNGIKLRGIKFDVDRFKLKESELGELGPVYTTLKIYNSC